MLQSDLHYLAIDALHLLKTKPNSSFDKKNKDTCIDQYYKEGRICVVKNATQSRILLFENLVLFDNASQGHFDKTYFNISGVCPVYHIFEADTKPFPDALEFSTRERFVIINQIIKDIELYLEKNKI